MLVEEAGQVLEAHVLGSLVDSIEHLILIGDPLQLRPTLNNYGTVDQMASWLKMDLTNNNVSALDGSSDKRKDISF